MLIQSSITTSFPEILSTADWCGLLARTPMIAPGWHHAIRLSGRELAIVRLHAFEQLALRRNCSLETVLRNAVALALRDKQDWVASLYLILPRISNDEGWIPSLQYVLDRALPARSWARIFEAPAEELSKYANTAGLPPTLRWQVTLAIRASAIAPITWRRLVQDMNGHVDVPIASLVSTLRTYLDARPLQRKIPVAHFSLLPLFAQVVLLRSQPIRDAVVASPSDAAFAYRPEVRQRWSATSTIRRRLPKFLAALRQRDYVAVSNLTTELADLPYARDEIRPYGKQITSALRNPAVSEMDTWQPMPSNVRAFVESSVEGIVQADRSLTLLGCTAKQVFDQAIAGTAPHLGSLLRGADLVRLHRTWTTDQKQQLLSAGRRDLLSDGEIEALNTAAHLRTKKAFDAFLASLKRLPTPDVVDALQAKWGNEPEVREHATALLLSDAPPASLVTAFFPVRRTPGLRRAFSVSRLGQAGFAAAINEAMSWWGNADVEWNSAVAEWICAPSRRNDDALRELIPFISANLASLAPQLQAKAHLATLMIIAKALPKANKQEFWNLLAPELEASPPRRRAVIEQLAADELNDSDTELRLTLLSRMPRLWYSYRPPTQLSDHANERDAIDLAAVAFQPRSWRIAEALVRRSPAAFEKALVLLSAHRSRQATLLLAKLIGFKYLPRLGAVAVRTQANAVPTGERLDAYYRSYKLPKQSGGSRTILVPAPWLKGLQRAIYQSLLHTLPAHRAAHGFVPGRSIITNATPHVQQPLVVSCDVSSAFPSVRWPVILHALRRDFKGLLTPAAIGLLVDTCCHAGGLPIGAPTSPALLNRVLLPLDEILEAEALPRDVHYTRYADDLTFSGARAGEMLPIARRLLRTIGLKLDPNKTNFFRPGRRQMVTGLVVNSKPAVPRRLRRRLRAAVHQLAQGLQPTWRGRPVSRQALIGWAAFLKMVNPSEGARLLIALRSTT